MTVYDGTKVYSPSSSYVWEQARIEVTRSGTTFTIKRYVYARSTGINDPQTSVATGSTPGGSDAFTANQPDSWQLISTHTFEGTPGSSYTFGHYIDKATIYFSPSTSPSVTSGSWFVPYLSPETPSTPTVTRNSDTSHTLNWTCNASSQARVQNQYIQRRYWTGSAWSSWSTISTKTTDRTSDTAESYTDTTTVANRVYQWRIVAQNSTAQTASGTSERAYTTPAALTGVTATKTESGDIELTFAYPSTSYVPDGHVLIEESQDGGAFATLTTVAGRPATYTHSSPSTSVTHQYRASFVVDAVDGTGDGLASATVLSGTVTLAAPPDAPTGLAPNGTAKDATDEQTLTWVHNPTDTSPQSKFQIRHRASSGDSWTEETAVESSTASWALAADTFSNGASSEPEWAVRTWGEHEDPSDWSATATIPMRDKPTWTINDPADGATLTGSTLTMAGTYYQAQGLAMSTVERTLLDSEDEVLEVLTSGDTFATAVEDGADYTVSVRTRSSSGQWSDTVTAAYSVDYLPPADVTLELEFDRDTGSMLLVLSADDPVTDVTVAATSAHVDRRVDGGAYTRITGEAIDLSAGFAAIDDRTCPVEGMVEYRVTAVSDSPSTAVMDPVSIEPAEDTYFYLSTGAAFSDVIRLWANPELSTSTGVARELVDIGREYPVMLAGSLVSDSTRSPFMFDQADVEQLRTIARSQTLHLLRGPGTHVLGALGTVPITEHSPAPQYAQTTIQMTRTGD